MSLIILVGMVWPSRLEVKERETRRIDLSCFRVFSKASKERRPELVERILTFIFLVFKVSQGRRLELCSLSERRMVSPDFKGREVATRLRPSVEFLVKIISEVLTLSREATSARAVEIFWVTLLLKR